VWQSFGYFVHLKAVAVIPVKACLCSHPQGAQVILSQGLDYRLREAISTVIELEMLNLGLGNVRGQAEEQRENKNEPYVMERRKHLLGVLQ